MARVHHDAFARSSYDRLSHGPGECQFCGQLRAVVYSYVHVPDDRLRGIVDSVHRRARVFCNLDCFKSYYL